MPGSGNRRPERTKLGIEPVLLNEEQTMMLMERMIRKLVVDMLQAELRSAFPRLPYTQAMARSGPACNLFTGPAQAAEANLKAPKGCTSATDSHHRLAARPY
jgi:hypothetical protein